jgi:transketolase
MVLLRERKTESAKKNLGWPTDPTFYVPDDVLAHFRSCLDKGKKQKYVEGNVCFLSSEIS